MSNKIIQSDNAVIDYTTISVMIDTINKQQKDIEDLKAALTHTDTAVNAQTQAVISTTGYRVIRAGHVQGTVGQDFAVSYSGFTTKPTSVIGIVQSTKNPKTAGCYINRTITQTETHFTVYGATGTVNLYWIAVGN
jgi:hypothetical protein